MTTNGDPQRWPAQTTNGVLIGVKLADGTVRVDHPQPSIPKRDPVSKLHTLISEALNAVDEALGSGSHP